MRKYQSYVICTSPRSGSTLLCKLLEATGKSGLPDSHFHEPSVSAWLEDYGLPAGVYANEHDALSAILDAAIARGSGETGIFGLRLQRHSFEFFLQKLGLLFPDLPGDAARLQAAFGKTLFIHLTRADKVEQAISYIKAEQTGLWHMGADGRELERLSEPGEPAYDAEAIAKKVDEMTLADREWAAWFHKENLTPLQIGYDELSNNPLKVLSEILEELGIDGSLVTHIALPTAKLSDDINELWAKQFRATNKA